MSVDIAERTAEEILKGLRPEAAVKAAIKAAGKAETVTWLEAAGERAWSRWTVERLARAVLETLLSRPGAWEVTEARLIREGDFLVVDEDALISVTGCDQDGRPFSDREWLDSTYPVIWSLVVENGLRVDQRSPLRGGYLDVLEVKRCKECGHIKDEDTRGDVIYGYARVLRLVRVGSHYVGATQ